MNQAQFLKQIDTQLSLMNQTQVIAILHEIALDVKINDRDTFLAKFADRSTSLEKEKRREQEQIKQRDAIVHDLDLIDQGKVWFGSKFNYEYEDWLDIGNECILIDHQNIGHFVLQASRFISKAIDEQNYDDALVVADRLFYTTFTVGGDCQSYFDGLDVFALEEYGVLKIDYDLFASQLVFLSYMCHPLSNRAEVLYEIMDNSSDICLKNLLSFEQYLDDLDDFLPLWKSFLESQEQYSTTIYLLDEVNTLLEERSK